MPDNVHLIIGNDEAQIAEYTAKLVEKVAGPAPDAFSYDVFQETESGPEPSMVLEVIRSIQSPPFLGGTKTVWLKNFTAFQASTAKTTDMGKALKELADRIEKGIPNDVVLIMSGPCDAGKKIAFIKTCQAHGNVVILNKPDKLSRNWQAEMSACIQNTAKDKELQLQDGVIDFLIGVLGTDTARIDAELEKIICYKGGTATPATMDEVMQVCEGQGEEYSWSFGNALGKRDLSECLRIIDAMSTQSKTPDATARTLILTSANFFRQALQIQIFMNQNKVSNPIALKRLLEGAADTEKETWKLDGADFVTMHPYRVQMIAENATRYRPQETIKAITTLRDAIWQCVSSATSPRVSLENALFAIVPR